MAHALPDRPPFVLRARVLTPLAAGGTRYEADGRIEVDAAGRIAAVGPWADAARGARRRPGHRPPPAASCMPGMVDLHVHLPQLPNAGVGAGLDLLTWLQRYIFPLERAFDEAAAERLAPIAFRAFAAAGTTTAVLYGAVFQSSLDAAFRAAEAHGIRAVIGKVMMDRGSYDDTLSSARILDASLRQSADLCARWHMRDDGRLRYAFTPRFAISCGPDMLRQSAELARETGAYWQTHVAEDRNEIREVARLFPDAVDYLDVYDQAGGLGPRTILAHAIHLSDARDRARRRDGCRDRPLPGLEPVPRLGGDAARALPGGGDPGRAGLGRVRRARSSRSSPTCAPAATSRAGCGCSREERGEPGDDATPLQPLDWLRLATYDGARALGQEDAIGSLEAGKEADMIAVDPRLVAPVPGIDSDDPAEVMSRLAFRPHADMVRGAWVRGRRLDGPPGLA